MSSPIRHIIEPVPAFIMFLLASCWGKGFVFDDLVGTIRYVRQGVCHSVRLIAVYDMCGCHRVTVKDVVSVWAAVQVLLLDEVTVDMDVVARLDLLDFFRCFPSLCAVLCMLSHALLRFAAS